MSASTPYGSDDANPSPKRSALKKKRVLVVDYSDEDQGGKSKPHSVDAKDRLKISIEYRLLRPGKEWKEKPIRHISNKVFDRVNNDDGSNLTFEELYIGVLLVFNDINKRLPDRHFDPPTNEQVRKLMEESDMNLDGALDREEFVKFIRRITKDTFLIVSQGLIIALAVKPTVALLTKRSTENVLGVGKVVEKIPNSIYVSLVTLVVVAFQQGAKRA